MKNLHKYFALTVVVLSFFNCVVEPMEFLDGHSNDLVDEIENAAMGNQANSVATNSSCENQDPLVRITNNGTADIDFAIYDVNGNTIAQENEIKPGEQSEWINFSSGETSFLISNGSSDKLITVEMGTCMVYDIEIDSNDQLVSDQPVQL